MTGRAPGPVIAFLGPSLPADAARALGPVVLRPPARQGDVWRALAEAPRAIALVDGVFESVPSVWHHELRSALDAGVAVLGASSMGALRAAELASEGMRGVGQVFAWVRDGIVRDDADVALLHAGPEHGWRGFTVPLVTVRDRLEAATGAGVLGRREARAVLAAAGALHFGERTWDALGATLPRPLRRRWPAVLAFVRTAGEDVKARDARACLRAALRVRRTGPVRAAHPPAAARRARREVPTFVAAGGPVRGADVLAALRAHRDQEALTARGLDRALLAGWARRLGLSAPPREVRRVEVAWLRALGADAEGAGRAWASLGLDAGTARRLAEDVVLAGRLRDASAQVLPDGPTSDEALLDEVRLTGLVPEAVARVTGAGGRTPRAGAGRTGRGTRRRR